MSSGRRLNDDSLRVLGRKIDLPMLLHLSRLRSNVASRVTWHSHPGYEILFLLDGATAYEFPGQKRVDLHGGEFLVVPPKVVHRGLQEIMGPCTICGIAFKTSAAGWRNTIFTPTDVQHLMKALTAAPLRTHPISPELRWLLRCMIQEAGKFTENPSRPDCVMALRGIVCGILLESMRQVSVPTTGPKLFVSAAMDYLRQHLREPITTKDLVRFVGFGRARMFDMFKSETGLSPKDYLQRLRIEKAREQLLATNQTITDIALGLGFKSGQYFSTVFSRYTGVAPTSFRKQMKGRAMPPSVAEAKN